VITEEDQKWRESATGTCACKPDQQACGRKCVWLQASWSKSLN